MEKPVTTSITAADRELLRDNVRRLLAKHWPAEAGDRLQRDPQAVREAWKELASQGITTLGSDACEGGALEVAIVMEELGRAACPAPLHDAAAINLTIGRRAHQSTDGFRAIFSGVARGQAALALSLGERDGDVRAGKAVVVAGGLSGSLPFIENAGAASHYAVVAGDDTLALVPINAHGLNITQMPGLGVPPLVRITFDGSPTQCIALQSNEASQMRRVLQVMLVARSLGAAERGFELVVDYVKQRSQFGRLIGSFQAIQHKLADCKIKLDAVRHMLERACNAFDAGRDAWRFFAPSLFAFASEALRKVSLETHHAFGAIGMSEEHEAPRHFRRTHGDLTRLGGPARARDEVATYLLDEGHALPEYDYGPIASAFRLQVRQWLFENWSAQHRAEFRKKPYAERGIDRRFQHALGRQGWIAGAWPTRVGGQQRSRLEQLVYMEELEFAEAPALGASLQAPALMNFGTDEQQQHYLPKIRDGEINFCLGYSEPDSGSDLASLKTSAVRDGTSWVINGQKIWNTSAPYADYIWLAARTDPQAQPRQAGISMFMVPINSPGISVQQSMAMYGRTFSTIFMDDVRVPDDALVGGVNEGWKVLNGALADERALMGGSVIRARRLFDAMCRLIADRSDTGKSIVLADSALWRDRVGAMASAIEAGRCLLAACVQTAQDGSPSLAQAAISKCYSAELMQALGELALDMLGMTASLSEESPERVLQGEMEQFLRHSMMYVIGGGTAEIQRNVIAQRGLGLPR